MSEDRDSAATLTMGFGGLRVVSFESRMADEAQRMIRKAGGVAISAPSLQEVPIRSNPAALAFGADLLAGRFDIVVFMTGVGAGHLFRTLEAEHPRGDLIAAFSAIKTVARGPKPIRALESLGIPVSISVASPHTWRETVAALKSARVKLAGARIAIQEYGAPGEPLVRELEARGATVTCVPVYRWALPDDISPVLEAADEVIGRTADVLLFTSASQVRNLLDILSTSGRERDFRQALAEVAVGSVGPTCTQALLGNGLPVDFEPETPRLGTLIKEAAERALDIVLAKRAPLRAAVAAPAATAPAYDINDSPFMRACRGEPTDYTPVWLMRQAGRYMQEYREVRARVPFIELCKNAELAADATITAVKRIGADAAIIFSDILLIVEPMGLGLTYAAGDGPKISSAIRSAADVDRIREVAPESSLPFLFDAIRRTRADLDAHIPLLGFSGAPFTLASYMIEGGGSRNYVRTKAFMYRDQGAWDAMMERISRAVADYLNAQIAAGVQAVQLFDSWVGCLSPADYERYVLPHTRRVFESLPEGVPAIHFGTDTATLLDRQVEAGASVLGLDHRVAIGDICKRYPDLTLQGNLDPVVLFADRAFIEDAARKLLDEVGGRPGHIFNLGHGILPGTPVDNVISLVDAVHNISSK